MAIDPNCPRCKGEGFLYDDTACADPEHCSPTISCHICNPDGEDE